jgi:hypothetical protein
MQTPALRTISKDAIARITSGLKDSENIRRIREWFDGWVPRSWGSRMLFILPPKCKFDVSIPCAGDGVASRIDMHRLLHRENLFRICTPGNQALSRNIMCIENMGLGSRPENPDTIRKIIS